MTLQVNKAFEKYEKQLKAAKSSKNAKQNADKVRCKAVVATGDGEKQWWQ